jgi:hypothetical protein
MSCPEIVLQNSNKTSNEVMVRQEQKKLLERV